MIENVDYLDFFDNVDDDWLAEFNESSKPLQMMATSITPQSDTSAITSNLSYSSDGDSCELARDPYTSIPIGTAKLSSSQPYKNSRYVSSFKKPQNAKVVWSLSNSKKGKPYERYIERQLRIARRLCKQLIKVLNLHDQSSFVEFVKYNFSKDFIYHEIVTGTNPFTGVVNSERFISGCDDFVTFVLSFFSGVPDSVLIIDSIEVLTEGKSVRMCGTSVGTPIKEVEFPEHMPIASPHTGNSVEPVPTMPAENSANIKARKPLKINNFAFPFQMNLYLDSDNMLQKFLFEVTTVKKE